MTAQRLAADSALPCCDRGGDHAARAVHGARVRARADLARSGAAAARTADLPPDRRGRDGARCAGPSTRWRCWRSASCRCWCCTLIQRLQGVLPFNPQGLPGVGARPRVQHRRVVHDQHQLAVLRRRSDDELLHADGRAGLPQLRLGGGRHRAGDRLHPRHRRRERRDSLGNFWVDMTRAALWVLLPFCLVGALVLVSQGVVQNLRPYDRVQLVDPQTTISTAADGAETTTTIDRAGHRAGAGGVAGDHQGVGHQRRRLLQRQQRPSLREPDAVHQLPRDVRDLRHLGGPDLHARPHDGSPRHGWAVWAAMAVLFLAGVTTAYWAEAAGQSAARRHRSDGRRDAPGRQHGRQGGALRHRQLGALRHGHDRRQLRRRELRCTTPSRRSAAWCRSST